MFVRFIVLSTALALGLVACSGKSTTDSGTAAAATCSGYCTTFAANCTGEMFTYTDDADCQTQCATWDQGEVGVEEVNTLECRWSHAQEAANDDHCGEAQADSTSCI